MMSKLGREKKKAKRKLTKAKIRKKNKPSEKVNDATSPANMFSQMLFDDFDFTLPEDYVIANMILIVMLTKI
eukprot:1373222-Amphidinium_carterae.1